ncbi:MAG TPA: serine/threonine-protein kinase [Trichocoleus sp.]|jgi:WD40 repeat protein/tRNA A-37 threonylcarbamoyl transferase component Bud32
MNSAQSVFWINRLIGDRHRYRVDKLLGRGGTADVFLATDTLLGQPVAVKLLHERMLAGEVRARFEREATLCAALKNEHIVQVSDYGVTFEGHPFFVMEYLQGQTLRELLKQERRLSVQRTANIISQVCVGLQLAHQGVDLWQDGAKCEQVKIIHRDLKPDNIFLVPTSLGELVKILDFGIAKIQREQVEQANVTRTFLGTYRYAAPEQFEVENDLDERADIYSLGVVIYEMLSGTDPFGFQEASRQVGGGIWAAAHLTKPPLPLRQQPACETLTPVIEAIVMQCLQKDPDRRFESVYQLDAALRAAIWGKNPVRLAMAQHTKTSDLEMAYAALPTLGSFQPTVATQPTVAEAPTDAVTHNLNPVFTTVASHFSLNPSWVPNNRLLRQVGAALSVAVATTAGLFYWSHYPSSSIAFQPQQSLAKAIEPLLQNSATSAAQTLSGHSDTVWTIATNVKKQMLASGSFDRSIRLWNLQTGAFIRTLSGHRDAVRSVTFSPDGMILVSGSSDKTIKLWDVATGQLLRTLAGHIGPVWSVAVSPDGQTVASGSYDGTIKLWDVATGELLNTLPGHYDSVWSVTFTPDSKTLISSAYDGTIKTWDLGTGKLLRTLSGHTDAVRSVAISPDGKTIVSGSWDKTIKVWNLESGAMLQTLSGHVDRVLSVAVSPDAKTIASGSLDKTIKIWDLASGQLLRTLTGHSDWVIGVAFGADAGTVVSGSKDKTVKLWQQVLPSESVSIRSKEQKL